MKAKQRQHSFSFVGQYEVTVLSDERIILPSDVIRQMHDHGIKRVFPGRLPFLKALVLCPETLWVQWTRKLKRSYPCLETHSGARSFIIPWKPITWDAKGRIHLPRQAREYAGIKPDHTVIILGNDYCFELWSEEKFNEVTRECETVLQRSIQPLSSTGKAVSPEQI
jgi:DNA-binding transcriptional regulator/RsmH inhibitor MraZ